MRDIGLTLFGCPVYTDEVLRPNEIYIFNQENFMGRKAGSKNKTLAEKVEDIIADVQELKVDSAEEAKEVAEAIDELEDIIAPKEEKGKVLVGKHPVSGESVYR